jgi:hypothetical protein
VREGVCRGELHSPTREDFLSQSERGGFTEDEGCRGELHSPTREDFFITEEGRGFHRGMIIFRDRNSVREQNYWGAPLWPPV